MSRKNTDKSNSRKIILSNATSKLGNSVFDYVNQMVISKLYPNSFLYMGIYQSVEQVTTVILNLFAGAVADYGNRKKLLILTDFISGLVCLVGSFFLASKYIYINLIICNILLAALFSFNSPLYNAVTKEAISEKYVEKHLSNYSIVRELVSISSPSLGIVVWKYLGLRTAYLFNAITFFASSFISLRITLINKKKAGENPERGKNVFSQIKEGLVFVYKSGEIRNLVLISSGINFFLSIYNLILPYTTNYYEGQLNNFYGKALVAQSLGAIALAAINKRHKDEADNWKMMEGSLFFLGLSLLLISILDSLTKTYINLVPYFLVGGFLTIFNIQFFSLVQKETPDEYIGRVYSVIFTVAVLFMPLGNILFGKILNTKSLTSSLVAGFGIILIMGVNRFKK